MAIPTDRERPALSEDDRALIKRELKAWSKEGRPHGYTYIMLHWSEGFIARLLAAARAEGCLKQTLVGDTK